MMLKEEIRGRLRSVCEISLKPGECSFFVGGNGRKD